MQLYILGIIIAAIILVVTLMLTAYIYLFLCTKFPAQKFKIEVGIVGFVLFSSLVVRLYIGYASLPENETFDGGVMSFFNGLISAIGGLTFESPLDISDMQMVSGLAICFYYGIIIYAGLVIMLVLTVGISYELYSRVQLMNVRGRFISYYVFTSITPDTILLAQDIKRRLSAEKDDVHKIFRRRSYAIIFFENSEESFSRKNPLHCKLMEEGFYFYSSFRRNNRGETVSFLKTFNFKRRDFIRDEEGKRRNKLFNVFAMDDCGGFEGDNGELVFDDLQSVLNAYTVSRNGGLKNDIPTTVNYFLLTGGEINYESYERRLNGVFGAHFKAHPAAGENAEELKRGIRERIQVNVFNEATLSSQDLVEERKLNLISKGYNAFALDTAGDENGAYRAVIIGFGKTGQYAMKVLYTHTASLKKTEKGYTPTRFIADVYDMTIDGKSGVFAYNHPMFRCINESGGVPAPTEEVIKAADCVDSLAYSELYKSYSAKTGGSAEQAKAFVDGNMQPPIAVFHNQSCFKYPFMQSATADAAIWEAGACGVRDFVVALGNDEPNITMANMLIDSYKRYILSGGKCAHVTIYVNLLETENADRINWGKGTAEEALLSAPYSVEDGKVVSPRLSVVTFGSRADMFSYRTLIDDYGPRLYNYGYMLLTEDEYKGQFDSFVSELKIDYDSYRCNHTVADKWLNLTPYFRRSNISAQLFAVNYHGYFTHDGGEPDEQTYEYLTRLEHERWDRFFISHGWTYADYGKSEKAMRRVIKQHNCLCPYDVMLDDYTKVYDRANVRLGSVGGIVYGGERKNGEEN